MLIPFLESILDEEDVDTAIDWLSQKRYQTCFEAGAAGIITTKQVAHVISQSMQQRWSTPDAYFTAVNAIHGVKDEFPLCIVGVDNISNGTV